jgi:hypothetical protein
MEGGRASRSLQAAAANADIANANINHADSDRISDG